MDLEVTAEVFTWRGPAPHHFVRVPEEQSELIADDAALVTYGWGMIPVTVRLGATTWTTSLWPKDGAYLVPLKAAARRSEHVEVGQVVTLTLTIGPPRR